MPIFLVLTVSRIKSRNRRFGSPGSTWWLYRVRAWGALRWVSQRWPFCIDSRLKLTKLFTFVFRLCLQCTKPTCATLIHAMKRSRACDNLVALATESSTHIDSGCSFRRTVDDWMPLDGPVYRSKRSRAALDMGKVCGDFATSDMTQDQHTLQFMLDMTDLDGVSSKTSPSLSVLARSSVSNDDSLPLQCNLRENMLQPKKKQRLTEVTNCFNDFNIHDGDVDRLTRAMNHRPQLFPKPQPTRMTETPESRIFRGLCFPRDSRCSKPLNKRQASPFDMSAIMLSISPKR